MLLKIGEWFELEIGLHMVFVRAGRFGAIYTRNGGLMFDRANASAWRS